MARADEVIDTLIKEIGSAEVFVERKVHLEADEYFNAALKFFPGRLQHGDISFSLFRAHGDVFAESGGQGRVIGKSHNGGALSDGGFDIIVHDPRRGRTAGVIVEVNKFHQYPCRENKYEKSIRDCNRRH
jgi:hypothetical protein